MSDRYYTNCSLAPGPFTVTGPEAHHLAVVCRIRPADAIYLFNGDGREYRGVVREVSKRTVVVDIESVEVLHRELGHRVHVAAPLPRGDRGQFLLEKLTELGATTYTPLVTQRSVLDPSAVRVEKLRRYVIEASKQCGRNTLLAVKSPLDCREHFRQADLPTLRWLADVAGAEATAPNGQDVAIAVGPEGGYTPDEIAVASDAGWKSVSLGPRTLRVETAAIALTVLAALPRSASS